MTRLSPYPLHSTFSEAGRREWNMCPMAMEKGQSRRRGMTLLEVLVTGFFLLVAVAYLSGLFSSSNRGTIDVYYETIAFLIAQETIESVGGIRCDCLGSASVRKDLDTWYGIDRFLPVTDLTIENRTFSYPQDYRLFERSLTLEKRGNAVLLTVRVRNKNAAFAFFRRQEVMLQRLVWRDYE